jgi:hypothetical protein
MKTLTLSEGAVTGAVRVWLKAEGLAVLIVSVLLYRYTGSSWWMFFGLLLTPDLSMLPYLINPSVGGAFYNVFHSYFLPLALAAVSVAFFQAGCSRMFLSGPPISAWIAFWVTV